MEVQRFFLGIYGRRVLLFMQPTHPCASPHQIHNLHLSGLFGLPPERTIVLQSSKDDDGIVQIRGDNKYPIRRQFGHPWPERATVLRPAEEDDGIMVVSPFCMSLLSPQPYGPIFVFTLHVSLITSKKTYIPDYYIPFHWISRPLWTGRFCFCPHKMCVLTAMYWTPLVFSMLTAKRKFHSPLLPSPSVTVSSLHKPSQSIHSAARMLPSPSVTL